MARTQGKSRKSGTIRSKPRSQAGQSPGNGRIPAYALGLVSGLVVALALTLVGLWPGDGSAPAAGEQARDTSQPPAGVRFEFPDMLRDSQALVPYVEEYLEEEETPPAEADVQFLLQAGAFRSQDDANRRRAQILLLDLSARTLEVSRDGVTWHRVLVGPFGDRNQVRNAQLRLLEDNIDSIVLRADPT